jgi:hypothetical protein
LIGLQNEVPTSIENKINRILFSLIRIEFKLILFNV